MPTLCEAVGIPLPDGVQGRSLWPLLTGGDYPREEFASVYAEHGFGGLHYGENEPLDPRKDGLVPGEHAVHLDKGNQPPGRGGPSTVSHQPSTMDHRPSAIPHSPADKWGSFDCLNSWTQSGTMRMVRKGDWKLVFDMQGRGQLYNLRRDPAEMEDLYPGDALTHSADARERELTCREMVEDLLTWVLRTQDPLPLPRRRYMMKRDPRNYWTPYRSESDCK